MMLVGHLAERHHRARRYEERSLAAMQMQYDWSHCHTKGPGETHSFGTDRRSMKQKCHTLAGRYHGFVHGDADRWDQRHAEMGPATPSPPEGLGSVAVDLPTTGWALDVACGRGAQLVWAAEQGLDVVGLDVSPVAVASARELAALHRVSHQVDVRVHDLDSGLPADLGRFDLVICQRFRAPGILPALVASLVDGGIAVLTVLSVVGAESPGPNHAPFGELAAAVTATGAEILLSTEGDGQATVVARARSSGPPPG